LQAVAKLNQQKPYPTVVIVCAEKKKAFKKSWKTLPVGAIRLEIPSAGIYCGK